jgi:hypothetical protein
MHPTRPATTSAAALPEWYQMYFDAVVEADEAKALMAIQRASRAIRQRVVQLGRGSPHNPREAQDLASALIYLTLLLHNISPEKGSPLWQ